VNDKNKIDVMTQTFVGRHRSSDAAKLFRIGEVVSPLSVLPEVKPSPIANYPGHAIGNWSKDYNRDLKCARAINTDGPSPRNTDHPRSFCERLNRR